MYWFMGFLGERIIPSHPYIKIPNVAFSASKSGLGDWAREGCILSHQTRALLRIITLGGHPIINIINIRITVSQPLYRQFSTISLLSVRWTDDEPKRMPSCLFQWIEKTMFWKNQFFASGVFEE